MRTRRPLRVLGTMMSLGPTFAVGPMRPAGAGPLEHPVANTVRHVVLVRPGHHTRWFEEEERSTDAPTEGMGEWQTVRRPSHKRCRGESQAICATELKVSGRICPDRCRNLR